MDYQYKIIVSNRTVYREFEITKDMERVRLGTTVACEFRLNPDSFFMPIVLELERIDGVWNLGCQDSVYISTGDMRKLLSTELLHGDVLSLRYTDSGDEAFELRYMIDFESVTPNYDWKVDLRSMENLSIGTDTGCDIMLKNSFEQSCRVLLKRAGDAIYLCEMSSGFGVYHNGKRILEEEKLISSDFFSVDEFTFYYAENTLYFDSAKLENDNGVGQPLQEHETNFAYPLFNRNTRIRTKLSDEKIQILDAPSIPKKPETNIVTTLMPAIIMLAVTVVMRSMMNNGSQMYILLTAFSMGMGIVTSIIGIVTSQKKYKQECQERRQKYGDYIEKKKVEVTALRQKELDSLNDIYCDIEMDVDTALHFGRRLFERTLGDDDFLSVYLGRGSVKAKRQIDYKEQDTLEVGDELTDMPERIHDQFEYLDGAPVTVDMKDMNAVGIVGDEKLLYGMFKNFVVDIAVRHYYGDVKMFVLIDDEKRYEWMKWLPHLTNDNGLRNIVVDNESKNNIFENLYRELTWREQNKIIPYHCVIFIINEFGIKNHPISRYIEKAASLGVTFVFFENREEELPLYCDEIVRLHSESKGEACLAEDRTTGQKFEYKMISDEDARAVAVKLAPVYCEEISLENSLRKNITLFELLHIFAASDLDLRQRWQDSKIYKTMEAPLGVNAKDEIVYLNLHEKAHGPHGLVAGTTGSGKSEILQTFILSAATMYHPYEIGFVIIDFKGGGMVNQFKSLPHLIGAITNIDGNEVQRSLKSIKAELLKRQSVFAEAGVNHIDKYIQLYKEGKATTALPHLVIIVDEFAELKAEQPEFMKELISAARIGRSLGVHLILATQKPSGVVDAQIWSNSKFKLCLKVQSREDSNEVLKTPLAAEIKEPGRAYLQVGNNEIFELFQSAYSGAPATMDESDGNKEFSIFQLNMSGMKKLVYKREKKKSNSSEQKNQLDALVDYIASYCEKAEIPKLPDICMPPLPEILRYPFDAGQKVDSEELYASIGLLDDPDRQSQSTLRINVTSQNLVLIGSGQSGKTNVLQTIIRSLAETYSPQELNMYIVDFGSMVLRNFAELNQVGGVVCASEDEKLKNLFKLLNTELEMRKNKFAEMGVSSFTAYKEAGGRDIPQIVVFIDNLTGLREMYMQENDFLLPLCRDGVAVGISFIVANGQTNGIGYRYLNNFEGRMTLFCNETSEYSTVFEGCRMRPQNLPGRALVQLNKSIYEIQIYIAFEGDKEYERVREIHKFVERQNQIFAGQKAKIIPEIPKGLTLKYVENNYPAYLKEANLVLGVDYNTVLPTVLDLGKTEMLVLSGKAEMGKDAFARYLVEYMLNAALQNMDLYIFDDMNRKWQDYEFCKETASYTSMVDIVPTIVDEIEQRLLARYEALLGGDTEALENEPWIVLVVESSEAIAGISADKKAIVSMKNILTKYKDMKVFVLFSNVENAGISFNGPELLKYIKDHRRYIIFEDANSIKLCDLSSTLTKKYAKTLETGDAFYINENELTKIKTVKLT